jgi:hypothetical protein
VRVFAMAKFKKKISLKSIISIVLVIGAVVGIFAVIGSIAKRDTKTVSSLTFSRGGLDAKTGEHVKTNATLYTEEAFDCKGLRIEPDFDSHLTYDVYYYGEDGVFLESRLGLTGVYDEDYPLQMKARVVIHPEIPEGESSKDFKIKFYEVQKIASKLKITVDKKQDLVYSNNLYLKENAIEGKTFHNGEVSVFDWCLNDEELIEFGFCVTSNKIYIDGQYEKYDMYFRFDYAKLPPDSYLTACIADDNGKVINVDGVPCSVSFDAISIVKDHNWYKLTIEVPDNSEASFLRISMPLDTENCYVFGYND